MRFDRRGFDGRALVTLNILRDWLAALIWLLLIWVACF
jgi:hypothetical protein